MMKKFLFYLLNCTWALPQNMLGFIVWCCCKIKKCPTYIRNDGVIHTLWKRYDSLSLGMFNFLSVHADEKTIKHEYGHTIQSNIFGPLWLILFGLPSLLWAGFIYDKCDKTITSYYWFYTESFADKLGGVIRK